MRFLFVCVAILQFLAPVLPQLGIGDSIGDRAISEGIGPELPPGIFFAIWTPIFVGYLITAIWALRAPTAETKQLQNWLVAAGIGNVAWMLSAQLFGSSLLDFLILLPILYCSWGAARTLTSVEAATSAHSRRLLHSLTVGLLAGWLCVAVSISFTELVRTLLERAPSDAVWHSLWLAVVPATALAAYFTRFVSLNAWFFVALLWGLSGIFWNTYFRLELHGLGLATLLVGLLILRARLRYRPNLAAQFYY